MIIILITIVIMIIVLRTLIIMIINIVKKQYIYIHTLPRWPSTQHYGSAFFAGSAARGCGTGACGVVSGPSAANRGGDVVGLVRTWMKKQTYSTKI